MQSQSRNLRQCREKGFITMRRIFLKTVYFYNISHVLLAGEALQVKIYLKITN